MANRIVQAHKIGKQKRKRPGVTNDPLNKTLSYSNMHYKLNRRVDVGSESSLSAEKHYSKNSAVKYSAADLTPAKHVFIPHTQKYDR